jgi:hypothetical protein
MVGFLWQGAIQRDADGMMVGTSHFHFTSFVVSWPLQLVSFFTSDKQFIFDIFSNFLGVFLVYIFLMCAYT